MDQSYDIVIAGAGIAGLTAALTAARLGRKTLVLSGDVLGGQLLSIEKIDGYPGFPDGVPGYDLCPIAQEQAMTAGAEFEAAEITGLEAAGDGWKVTTPNGDITASAVIVATGANLKHLGVPGEERLEGKGVSHCATCDGPLLKNKVAAIVGGGDSALQEALTLAEFASKTIILNNTDALAGQPAYRDRVEGHPKIEIHNNTVVEEILGDAAVSGLRVRSARRCVGHRDVGRVRLHRSCARERVPQRQGRARREGCCAHRWANAHGTQGCVRRWHGARWGAWACGGLRRRWGDRCDCRRSVPQGRTVAFVRASR